jgi:glutamate racemase
MNFADLKNEPGLVLSTSATHQTGFYQYEIRSVGFQNLQFLACPGLAEAVEEGDSQKQFDILQNLVGNNQLRPTQAKLVVLGCTHYKFAQSSIQGVFSRAKIVEPSQFIATRLLDYLVRHPEFDSPNLGQQLVSTAEFKNGISQFNYTGLVSLAVPQLNTQGGN